MKKLILGFIGVAIFITLVGLLTKKNQEKLSSQLLTTPSPDKNLKTIKLAGTLLKVSLADTKEKRSQGLSGVKNLADDEAMLFIFAQKNARPSFWMKDMLISLDIIWINDGQVTQINKNISAPAPATSENDLTLYQPLGDIDYVVETNAGFTDKNNIHEGSQVDLSAID